MSRRPVVLRIGPHPVSGAPAIEMVFADGTTALAELEVSQAHRAADRIRECIDGRVRVQPPSRRVLEIAIGVSDEAPSSLRGLAVVPDLEADRAHQGDL